MAVIEIDHVTKTFGAVTALGDAALTVRDGEFLALLGPSGCGKTTLLRIIAGLERQSGGRVLIGGRDVTGLPPRRRGLAMVFQNYAVFPHLTVYENVAFGLRVTHVPAARIRQQVERAAALLHIDGLLARHPAQLSGGQRQRVAVARALAVEPAVLLMDEPLSNLDALLRLEMRAELKSVLAGANTTTIYVTHDQTEAMGLADRIAVMQQGRIEQIGTPAEVYHRPRNRFVGSFVGSPPMNFLTLPVADGRVSLGALSLTPPQDAGNAILLGLRAEDLSLADEREGFPFVLRVAEPLGPHALLTGTVAGQVVRAVVPEGERFTPGSTIHLRPHPGRLHWMDAASGVAREVEA